MKNWKFITNAYEKLEIYLYHRNGGCSVMWM